MCGVFGGSRGRVLMLLVSSLLLSCFAVQKDFGCGVVGWGARCLGRRGVRVVRINQKQKETSPEHRKNKRRRRRRGIDRVLLFCCVLLLLCVDTSIDRSIVQKKDKGGGEGAHTFSCAVQNRRGDTRGGAGRGEATKEGGGNRVGCVGVVVSKVVVFLWETN